MKPPRQIVGNFTPHSPASGYREHRAALTRPSLPVVLTSPAIIPPRTSYLTSRATRAIRHVPTAMSTAALGPATRCTKTAATAQQAAPLRHCSQREPQHRRHTDGRLFLLAAALRVRASASSCHAESAGAGPRGGHRLDCHRPVRGPLARLVTTAGHTKPAWRGSNGLSVQSWSGTTGTALPVDTNDFTTQFFPSAFPGQMTKTKDGVNTKTNKTHPILDFLTARHVAHT